jgi:hypothetical protein
MSNTAIEQGSIFCGKIIGTILTILQVLPSEVRRIQSTQSIKGRGIPLAELLKGKATMP